MHDLTIDEAEAWRSCRDACATSLRRMARDIRKRAAGCGYAMSNAATLESAADALAEMEPPPMPDGLCGRGA